MTSPSQKFQEQRAVALITVLMLVVLITALVLTVFSNVGGERRAAQHGADAKQAEQLAYSASQLVASQITAGSTLNPLGGTWTSQPGLLRTFTASGAGPVYKLYSASTMVTDAYAETDDAPPPDWKSQPAVFVDLNAPATGSGGSFFYPIADPSLAFVSTTAPDDTSKIPGFFVLSSVVPGYAPGTPPSPGNNPLPMAVRWLYVLKDGRFAVPDSVDATGNVIFLSSSPLPDASNPVVGRIAFWTDDDTSKINVNTAGYGLNDSSYWTYWDTPMVDAQDEVNWLSWAQPWTNEFPRYPGHPATTDLGVVFESLPTPPTREQIFQLTPQYRDGGTEGGNVRLTSNPTTAQTEGLLKNERLFASMDEAFYTPMRGANSAGISEEDLEARRFFLTATSRAPDLTLWGTPRVTIWPTFRTESKRTALDRLIAFTARVGGQPFHFVRENAMSDRELLDFPENLSLWNYLQELSNKPVPGFGGSFGAKYGGSYDQILTSVFDAVRLVNLDDRTPPVAGSTSGWSFTAGELRRAGDGRWLPFPASRTYTPGFVAPSTGPSNTRAAGRASTLVEVAFLFARPNGSTDLDSDGVRRVDKANVAVLYGFTTPSAGFVQPGVNRRIRVSGLDSFSVRASATDPAQQIFPPSILPGGIYDSSIVDGMGAAGANVSRRELGGRLDYTNSQMLNPPGRSLTTGASIEVGPPTGTVTLPFDPANPNASPFLFSGGTLTIEVFSPATAASPYQTYTITFPPASVLSPMLVTDVGSTWVPEGRWQIVYNFNNSGLSFEGRMSFLGDTLLAMQSPTGDFRSEVLRSTFNDDFVRHRRYGSTSLLSAPGLTSNQINQFSRRASAVRFSENLGPSPDVYAQIFGQLIEGFNGWEHKTAPVTISHTYSNSIQQAFPPGDFSSGPGAAPDGSQSPKSDEGGTVGGISGGVTGSESPYFRSIFEASRGIAGPTLASPNREVPSPIYFGSISTGDPWRTLLFRPARSYFSGGASHPGNATPPDYLMLDWFHMPVVEPYAISEPLSTAGRVNLNSALKPFDSYVIRESGLHALLRSTRIPAIPYPDVSGQYSGISTKTRHPVDASRTLELIRKRFDGSDGSGRFAYVSHSEICSVNLIPEGETESSLNTFWSTRRTTGDNLLEAAYTSLIPRLTTRSNTYTVHVIAQTLKPGAAASGWNDRIGSITAEWRGEFNIERYIDPADPALDGSALLDGSESLETKYRFRTLSTRRFNP